MHRRNVRRCVAPLSSFVHDARIVNHHRRIWIFASTQFHQFSRESYPRSIFLIQIRWVFDSSPLFLVSVTHSCSYPSSTDRDRKEESKKTKTKWWTQVDGAHVSWPHIVHHHHIKHSMPYVAPLITNCVRTCSIFSNEKEDDDEKRKAKADDDAADAAMTRALTTVARMIPLFIRMTARVESWREMMYWSRKENGYQDDTNASRGADDESEKQHRLINNARTNALTLYCFTQCYYIDNHDMCVCVILAVRLAWRPL